MIPYLVLLPEPLLTQSPGRERLWLGICARGEAKRNLAAPLCMAMLRHVSPWRRREKWTENFDETLQ
eukprot:3385835-Pleurochrysis_carterae.AAC.2